MSLETERLRLRQWRAEDREPFAAMNADPIVMRHFPSTLEASQSDRVADRLAAGITDRGWGFWAAELRETGEFIGFLGLEPVTDDLPFAPAVEIGWRLAAAFHGYGYATEGALRTVRYAFETIGLPGLVSMTTTRNLKSRRVMEKLGMTHDPAENFVHPRVPPDWPEKEHVLYRLERPS
jgi:RimJ/RimL family protein N-acetyltransferase